MLVVPRVHLLTRRALDRSRTETRERRCEPFRLRARFRRRARRARRRRIIGILCETKTSNRREKHDARDRTETHRDARSTAHHHFGTGACHSPVGVGYRSMGARRGVKNA